MTKSHNIRAPATTLKFLYCGTLLTSVILSALLLTDLLYGINPTYFGLEISIGVLIYLAIVGYILKRKAYLASCILLLTLYFIVASISALIWTINVPVSVLMFGFVILSSGFLLGSYAILPVTAAVITAIFGLHFADPLIHIDVNRWDETSSCITDVIGHMTFYSIYAFTALLASRTAERHLAQALQAQTALSIQKRKLAHQLEVQTEALQDVKIDEMKQLYRFAELGQLTVISLHDLANQISILALDIDSTREESKQSLHSFEQTKRSIADVESLISQARSYIDDEHRETFNTPSVILQAVKSLRLRARRFNVTINTRGMLAKPTFELHGNPTRLTQVLSILVINAVQASQRAHDEASARVTVSMKIEGFTARITVTDTGTPFDPQLKHTLFKLQKSTKEDGNGIGLFIAKKVIETHFHGSLWFEERGNEKRFIIELPSPVVDPDTFYKKS